jgi:hypothetical protein
MTLKTLGSLCPCFFVFTGSTEQSSLAEKKLYAPRNTLKNEVTFGMTKKKRKVRLIYI